ncbi:MAG: multicopper oxidase family protein [Thermomicrobiales bacterium]
MSHAETPKTATITQPVLHRRRLLGVTAVTVLAGALPGARAAAAAQTPEATPVASVALTQPEEYVSENGVLTATLDVTRGPVMIGGVEVIGTTYNGAYVAPTLRLRAGERLELTVNNHLPEVTNMHFHGMHVSPSGISDNVFIVIEPGASQNYVLEIPENHTSGTFWYHTHAHPYTEPQVMGGLAGLLIVDGLQDLLPEELRDISESAIVLKDYQAKDGAILLENIDSNAPTTRTVNGLVNPEISLASGETQLWRLANIGADIYYEIQLTGHQLHIIGEDGNPVWQVNSVDSIVIAPGKRFDVLVQAGEAGTAELKTLQYDQQGDLYPETLLATVTIAPSGQTAAALPTALLEPYDLSGATVDMERTITFAKDQATGHFLIDGQMFDENRIDQAVKLGAIEDWTIINDNNQQHPFHIHTNDFQVISINDEPYPAVGHQDTVNLPAFGKVVVRIPFLDFTGKFVYHCHILNHADMGMMATVEVSE